MRRLQLSPGPGSTLNPEPIIPYPKPYYTAKNHIFGQNNKQKMSHSVALKDPETLTLNPKP